MMKMLTRLGLILFLFFVVARLATAEAQGVRGKAFVLGLVDAGTLPAAIEGGCVWDVISQALLCSDGGTWNTTSSAETNTLTNVVTPPAAPSAGTIQLFSQAIGPCGVPFYLDSSGAPIPIMGGLAVSQWKCAVNVPSGTSLLGQATYTAAGTVTNQPFDAGGNFSASGLPYLAVYTSVAGATNKAGVMTASGTPFVAVHRGLAAGRGGWVYWWRGGLGSPNVPSVSTQRFFAGLSAKQAALAGNVEWSAEPNVVALNCDSNNADNMTLISNDASGSATAFQLDAGFPCRTPGLVLDFYMCSPSGGSTLPDGGTGIGIYIRRLDSSAHEEVAVTLTSDLPDPAQPLMHQSFVGNGTDGGVVALYAAGVCYGSP